MKNFVQTGDNITVAAPSGGVSSGDPVLVENLFGVAVTSADEGDPVVLATRGVYTLPKRTTATFSVGTAVSFVIATKKVDVPGSGAAPIGVATEAAGNGATTCKVRLDGTSTAEA